MTKNKFSEIHISESIIKSSDFEKLLDALKLIQNFIVIVLFHFVVFFKPNLNKFITMITMIDITIIDTYPLKSLTSRKLKLLEIYIDNELNFAQEY